MHFDAAPPKTTEVVLAMSSAWHPTIPRIDDRTFPGTIWGASAETLATDFPDLSFELWVRQTDTGLTTRVYLPLKFSTLTDPAPVIAANFDELQIPGNSYTLRWSALADLTASDSFNLRIDDHTAVPLLLASLPLTGDRFDFTLAGTDFEYSYLSDPAITLAPLGQTAIATNDDWGSDPAITSAARRLGAFAFPDSSRDAALLRELPRGVYTLQVSGKQAERIALVEIYDGATAAVADGAHLVNVSSRTRVGTGDGVLVAGFVISGATSQTVLIRGLGPRLGDLGVTNFLADPVLQLYRNGALLATNDNWGGAADLAAVGAEIGALAFTDAASTDSALLFTLPPGVYSALLKGTHDVTGVDLIEIYAVP